MSEIDAGREIMDGIEDTLHLILDARVGNLDSPDSMTLNLRGSTPADALGHAYHLRDMLEDEGFDAEATHLGLADEQPDWSSEDRHEIRLSWEQPE